MARKWKARVDQEAYDGLPEADRESYESRGDGFFYLAVEGFAEHPEALGVVNKNRELLGEKKALADRLKLFEGIDDPDAAREALRRLPDLEAAAAGAPNAETIQKMQADHAEKLSVIRQQAQQNVDAANKRAEAEAAAALDYYTNSEIDRALMEHRVEPEFARHIVAARVKSGRGEDGKFWIRVLDEHGVEAIKDGKMTPKTPSDFVAELRDHPKYGVLFPPTGAGGSGALPNGSAGGGGGQTTTVRAQNGVVTVDPAKVAGGQVRVVA